MQTTRETRTSTFLEHVLRIVRTVGVALMIVAVSTLVMNPAYASENDDSESAGAASLDAPLQAMDRADMIAQLMNGEIAAYSVGQEIAQAHLMDRADTIAYLSDLDTAGTVRVGEELRSIDIADMINALENRSGNEDKDNPDMPATMPRH
jgi:hypothetical protein